MDANQLRDAYVRQRRNLMVISLVILFAESAELTVKQINVFGNHLELSKPETVTAALWVAFSYWLWRYSVYFHDLQNRGLVGAYRHKMIDLVTKVASAKIIRESISDPDHEMHGWSMVEARSSGWYVAKPLHYELDISIVAAPTSPSQPQGTKTFDFNHYVVTVRGPLVLANARAWLHVLFRQHMFSEYVLPFLVAAAPLGYMLWNHL